MHHGERRESDSLQSFLGKIPGACGLLVAQGGPTHPGRSVSTVTGKSAETRVFKFHEYIEERDASRE